jgi:hypothetical protein
VQPYYSPDINDATLVFESRFESGNLAMAAKVSDSEYNLLLQNDVNSQGHTQWFFFKVSNTTKHLRVKFNIVNLVKGASLYNQGMQVAVYSQQAFLNSGQGWFRGGEDISYFPNGYRRENVASKSYFTVTFTYEFAAAQDSVYFAYSVPYTYSQLKDYLNALEADPLRGPLVTRKTLCRTIAGNRCEALTITNPGSLLDLDARMGVVVSARVHPGETVGSWMMHGVLDYLTSAAPEANHLRELFVFKIVPMLNPDGVINGNHRTNLTGADLNRRWKYPSKLLHPTIYSMKRMIKQFACKTDIEVICDFHGHSRKKNIFMYGCNLPRAPEACKLFPFVLSKVNPNFTFRDCRFGMQKAKEATLRISLFKELKIPKVYTLEASFAGPDSGPQAHSHFTTKQLEDMGRDFLLAILALNPAKVLRAPKLGSLKGHRARTLRKTADDVSEISKTPIFAFDFNADNICAEFLQDEALLRAGEETCSSDDSDSEPSEDNLDSSKLSKLIPKEPRIKHTSLPRTTAKKRELLKLQLRAPLKYLKKCPECREILMKNHVCSLPQTPASFYSKYSSAHDRRESAARAFSAEEEPQRTQITSGLNRRLGETDGHIRARHAEQMH